MGRNIWKYEFNIKIFFELLIHEEANSIVLYESDIWQASVYELNLTEALEKREIRLFRNRSF